MKRIDHNKQSITGNHNVLIDVNKGFVLVNQTQEGVDDKNLNLVPYYDRRNLFDRVDITKTIHETLMDTNEMVVLTGVGGIGKTSIALAYCNDPEIQKYYDHIAWVTVTNDLRRDMMHQLSNGDTGFDYKSNGSEEDEENYFFDLLKKLGNVKGNNLIVFDNANDSDEILNNKSYLNYLRWKVLVTSRSRPDGCRLIDVTELELQHCKELFRRYYKRGGFEDRDLEALINNIGRHTLLVELIAKAGDAHPGLNATNLAKMIQNVGSITESDLSVRIPITDLVLRGHGFSGMFRSYDYIRMIFNANTLSESKNGEIGEKDCLKYFSVLPYLEFPYHELVWLFHITKNQEIDFIDTLNGLVTKGWLMKSVLENNGEKIDTYRCHQLIQAVLRDELDISAHGLEVLIQSLIDKIEEKTGDNWINIRPYILYVDNVIHHVKYADQNFAVLLREYANYLNNASRYAEAKRCSEKALGILQDIECDNGLEWAKTLYAVGRSLRNECCYGKSLDFFIRAKDFLEQHKDHGEEFEKELGKTFRNIGNCYRNLARNKESIDFHKKAIAIFDTKASDDFQLELASCYDNIGYTYSTMKQFKEALEYRLLSYELRKRYLKEDHPSINASLNNIGVVYSKMSQPDKALEYHLLSLNNRINNFGEEHPTVAIAYSNLSDVYRRMRNFDKALECGKKAGAILDNTFTSNRLHQRFANYQVRLAKTYFDIRNLDDAKKYADNVFEIRKANYPPTHSDYYDAYNLSKEIDFALVEREYWSFRKSIKLSQDISPTNLLEQKELFISKFRKKERYNPIFQYENNQNESRIDQLNQFLDKFNGPGLQVLELKNQELSPKVFPFVELYNREIKEDIEWIRHFNQRSEGFPGWLSALYGRPESECVQKAFDIINSVQKVESHEKTIDATEAKHQIAAKLKEYGFDWAIEITDQAAKMSVNSLLKTIKIKKAAMFDEREMKRLLVHEIETHVLRSENGRQQRFELFSFGFPDYLETEEGLAILAEHTTGLRNDSDDLRFALRVVLCDQCFEMDFWDLFNFAVQHVDVDTAFDMVARIKRGLVDTGQLGGYTKDQVYFKGYLKLKDLPVDTLRKLYIGKIGLQHLDLLNDMNDIFYQVRLPEWIGN